MDAFYVLCKVGIIKGATADILIGCSAFEA